MNKVVLAYSGGLDTSVAVAWLKEQYGVEVITLTVDVGGGSLREGVERRAMKAERETFDRLLAHFLADRIGATFEGHISVATRAGLFVKLDDTGADGFIPARTIGGDEYFRYREDRHALIGDRSGVTHRLGDPVTVRLIEAAPVAGALRFELLSEGRVDGGGRRRPERGAHRPSASHSQSHKRDRHQRDRKKKR